MGDGQLSFFQVVLQLELGRTYVTRRGSRAFAEIERGDGCFHVRHEEPFDDDPMVWHAPDGAVIEISDKKESPWDLVRLSG